MATSDPLGLGAPPAAGGGAQGSPSFYGLPAGAIFVSETGKGQYGTGPGGRAERPEGAATSGMGQSGAGYTSADLYELASLPAEQLASLQRQLASAGLIKGAYRLGRFDNPTGQAIEELFGFANQRGQDYRQVLSELTAEGALAKARSDARAEKEAVQFDTRLDRYERTDPARIRLTAEEAFRQSLGRKPTDKELNTFVKNFQNTELNRQRTDSAQQDAVTRAQLERRLAMAKSAGGPEGPSSVDEPNLDEFMDALAGQESGGNYNAKNGRTGAAGKFQIMPSNWAPWALEAGLGANAPRSPQNQEIVARFKMQQYYDQFGSWDAVAVAWYAGPARAKEYLENPDNPFFSRRHGKKGSEPSVKEYVQQVRGRMGAAAGPATTGGDASLDARVAQMMADAPGRVSVTSGKRSTERQAQLWAAALKKYGSPEKARKWVAPPGSSKHESGEANDLKFENDAVRKWVHANAARYGLAFPLSNEPWHIETVEARGGASHAHGGAPAAGNTYNGQALSQSYSVTNEDLGAQAVEYARKVNPVETAAYDIGSTFSDFVGILQKGFS